MKSGDEDYLVLFCSEIRRKKCNALRVAFQEISNIVSLTETPKLRLATYDVIQNEVANH